MATKRKRSAPPRTTVNARGFFEPFNLDDVRWQRPNKLSTAFKQLGRFGGGTQVGVGIDVLAPRQYSNRFHYHTRQEEHVYVVTGAVTLFLGDDAYLMQARDYCCFPAGQAAGHHLFNHTDEICVFFTIGNSLPDDEVCFPEKKRPEPTPKPRQQPTPKRSRPAERYSSPRMPLTSSMSFRYGGDSSKKR
jgi:uncharacterized cupin superfamily protein